ncbi:MAG: DNA alkylation repair protein [Ruminococcus sp.]|nr:DNA alkylation repair protein [Ruminococcus sp.]
MYNIEFTDFKSTRDITEYLNKNKDEKYRDFTSALIPNIDKDSIIGVRTPKVRSLAKVLKNSELSYSYLNELPHRYLEENHLHGFLIELEKDFAKALNLTTGFLPYIDNWATCDTVRPKVFKKHLALLYPHIKEWLKSDHTYTVRYAIGLLNSFYLDDAFTDEHLKLVSNIKSDEYYINMMIAWYFATALYKQYDKTAPYIENKLLDKWTHNKAIQKACESLRIDSSTKSYLRTLKIR